MKLITELRVSVKKGAFPQLIAEVFKNNCEVQNLKQIESTSRKEVYSLEVVYFNRDYFKRLISIIKNSPERYSLTRMYNVLEEKVRGGLLTINGKMDLENSSDYEMNLLGATNLIFDKINAGKGTLYTGIGKSVGMISCLKIDDDTAAKRMEQEYTNAERDSVVLSRFSSYNPFPMVVQFRTVDDLLKTIQRISNNFSCMRIMHIDDADLDVFFQLAETLPVPVVSRDLVDIPLYLLILIISIITKHDLQFSETTVGFVGLDLPSRKLTQLLVEAGCLKVLGYDHDEKYMFAFEHAGGLATTVENILINADIVICFRDHLTAENYLSVRPGQFFISLLSEGIIDWMELEKMGVREHIQCEYGNLSVLFPGIIQGLLQGGFHTLDNQTLVDLASEMAKMVKKDYTYPDIFSDIHEKITELIVKQARSEELEIKEVN